MKTWMKAIPLVAGLALMSGALAAPARADDDDRRKRGERVQMADHRGHGQRERYGHKKGYKYGHRQGYREGRRHGRKYERHHGRGHKHNYGHRPHYGHGRHAPRYGHRYYVPYPAFVFRYYHNSSYEAPAERYPQVQPQVTQAVATQVAQNDSWPETCLMTREYQTEITVGGEVVEGYGQACLQPDGSWYRGPAVAVQ